MSFSFQGLYTFFSSYIILNTYDIDTYENPLVKKTIESVSWEVRLNRFTIVTLGKCFALHFTSSGSMFNLSFSF